MRPFQMTQILKLRAMVAVLKDVRTEYSGKTIDNIITQLEARIKEAEKRQS